MLKYLFAATAIALSTTAVQAQVVNLSADPSNPNAGNNSPGFSYNPVTLSLAAGIYSVGVVGTSTAGALYDAYSVYAPTASNGAFTDGNWSVAVAGGATQTQFSTNRFNTAAGSLAYYSALAPLTFSLTGTTNVSFFVDDTKMPYFADDAGGVSLSIKQITGAVPEPASWAMMILGMGAVGFAMRSAKRRSEDKFDAKIKNITYGAIA